MGITYNIKGIKPYYHQKVVINELKDNPLGKIVVVNSSRQKGKSYMVSNLLIYYASRRCGNKCFYITPTLKQARSLFELIVKGIIDSGIIKSKNKTELTITFINGSVIYFKSAEQRDALRGFTADFLAIDEAAFIPDDIFYLILPYTDAKKAPMLITSTPFVKEGFFWKYYNYGLSRTHNCITIDWADEEFKESIEQILPPDRLEEYRQTLPKNVFLSEYMGHFLDGEGSVFEDIRKHIKQAVISPTDKLYCGIDWANQGDNDYTVLSVFNQKGEQVLLRYWNRKTPLGQIHLIYKELEPYLKQIAVIVCETNSIGTPYTDLLKEKSQIMAQKIRDFNTSHTGKNSLVVNFQAALEKEGITLLDDKEQIRQFSVFTANFNPKTRNITYSAPNGLHDDIPMATMFAYDGLKNGQATGNYVIGFDRRRGLGR